MFQKKLEAIIKKNNSLVCVGLDSDLRKIPQSFKLKKYPIFDFNQEIIKNTAEFVCAYKVNLSFYLAEAYAGIAQLKMTFDFLRQKYPRIVTILDGKWADISSSNEGYVKFAFDYLKVDGVTVNPYLGQKALRPFLERTDKGIFVLCRTSNPGASEFQDLSDSGEPLYQKVARKVAEKWNVFGNCFLVVGATYPSELAKVRKIVGEMILLVAGIGAQGGDLEKTVRAGLNSQKAGIIVNSSRGIIFSKNPREEAKRLRNKINKYR